MASKNKSKTYTKNVGEPWFSLIKLGLKSVEGRLNKGEFSKFKKNDIVVWTNNDFGNLRSVKTIINYYLIKNMNNLFIKFFMK